MSTSSSSMSAAIQTTQKQRKAQSRSKSPEERVFRPIPASEFSEQQEKEDDEIDKTEALANQDKTNQAEAAEEPDIDNDFDDIEREFNQKTNPVATVQKTVPPPSKEIQASFLAAFNANDTYTMNKLLEEYSLSLQQIENQLIKEFGQGENGSELVRSKYFTGDRFEALKAAAAFGHEMVVRMLIQEDKSLLNRTTPEGLNAFLIATSAGKNGIMKLLVWLSRPGLGQLLSKTNDNRNAIMIAAEHGRLMALKFVTSKIHFQPHKIQTNTQKNALMFGIQGKDIPTIKHLHKLDPKMILAKDSSGVSTLDYAERTQNAKVITLCQRLYEESYEIYKSYSSSIANTGINASADKSTNTNVNTSTSANVSANAKASSSSHSEGLASQPTQYLSTAASQYYYPTAANSYHTRQPYGYYPYHLPYPAIYSNPAIYNNNSSSSSSSYYYPGSWSSFSPSLPPSQLLAATHPLPPPPPGLAINTVVPSQSTSNPPATMSSDTVDAENAVDGNEISSLRKLLSLKNQALKARDELLSLKNDTLKAKDEEIRILIQQREHLKKGLSFVTQTELHRTMLMNLGTAATPSSSSSSKVPSSSLSNNSSSVASNPPTTLMFSQNPAIQKHTSPSARSYYAFATLPLPIPRIIPAITSPSSTAISVKTNVSNAINHTPTHPVSSTVNANATSGTLPLPLSLVLPSSASLDPNKESKKRPHESNSPNVANASTSSSTSHAVKQISGTSTHNKRRIIIKG